MTTIIVAGVAIAVALFVLGLVLERAHTRRRLGALIAAAPATPPSVYPRIDATACICSGACVQVCPEKDVLVMIAGRPRLVQPAACIGHSDCLRSCPVGAIELVLGSAARPVEVPIASGTFETTVPGLYVAGEIGGIGLIHNAVAQGKAAAVGALDGLGTHTCELDLVVVGSGTAGLGAALEAKRRGVRFAVFEKGTFGGAIRAYPRQKVVMTAPMDLPGIGKLKLRRTTKEALLEMFEDVVKQAELTITERAEVTAIARRGDGFEVEAAGRRVTARRVILAIGRRGVLRRLEAPGAELPHVVYEVLDPTLHRGERCVVVGGGDSAVEIALALAAQSGTRVTLVHRSADLSRVKPDNVKLLAEAQEKRRIRVRLSTEIVRVHPDRVELSGHAPVPATLVVCCLGAALPAAWLRGLGMELKAMRGEALRRVA